ncbi:hypothetical protein PoB_000094900 [Plakobranchus ocellatus]|uniref:Secreted protein n=1 Tax=Plakobranchus ocellatus TaxID=259542 RepID=A0AAV3XU52_9GAST|nr:hypothetical protein PoB_000094900 [Plakobranchus ocellatus]
MDNLKGLVMKRFFVIIVSYDILLRTLFVPRVSGGVGSTVACESALRSAGTLLSRVRAPLPAPWPDGGPESLRSPCCGLAIYKKLKKTQPSSIQYQLNKKEKNS